MTPRVLIIDDEPNLCANLCAFLEDEGMEVYTVSSGEEAVAFFDCGERVDVVVSDMRLPGMNGDDTIRAVHASHPGIQFTIHTGMSGYSIPDDLRAIGIEEDRVFKKPLRDMGRLADTIFRLAAPKGDSADA